MNSFAIAAAELRAIHTQLNVIGDNVANVTTPGYSARAVQFVSMNSLNGMGGVKVGAIVTAPNPGVDLVAGKVDYACDQIVNLVEQIKGGTIKAYAIATPKRSPALPDVPTTIEAGLPGYQVSAWNAMFAPKGTPTEIVTKLTAALNKALDDPDTKKRLLDLGGVLPEGQERTSAWLGTFVAQEVARWTPIIQKGGAVQAQ